MGQLSFIYMYMFIINYVSVMLLGGVCVNGNYVQLVDDVVQFFYIPADFPSTGSINYGKRTCEVSSYIYRAVSLSFQFCQFVPSYTFELCC